MYTCDARLHIPIILYSKKTKNEYFLQILKMLAHNLFCSNKYSL